MTKKFYVVWVGRGTGVFTSWPDTKKQVDVFPGAKYKAFKTHALAEAAYAAGGEADNGRGEKAVKPVVGKRQFSLEKGRLKQSDFNFAPSKMFDVVIYCDGACDPNPGKAASGVAVYREGDLRELWYGLYNPQGTNNTAELNALHQALNIAIEDRGQGKAVQIRCDSQYAINCITVWAFSWKKKAWRRKQAGDIKNLEIIQQAHALYEKVRSDIVISHVKAHSGIEGNELADRMSVYGIDQKASHFCKYSEPLDIQKILDFRTG